VNKPSITPARGDASMQHVIALFTEYATWLQDDYDISLDFQGFDAEVSSLPGKYAQPTGELYLATAADKGALGCIAFRNLEPLTCEIKRLYVRPTARGMSLGKRLVETCLDGARTAGYKRAVLDTKITMKSAQSLYESFGFSDIPRYNDKPLDGVRYMAADL